MDIYIYIVIDDSPLISDGQSSSEILLLLSFVVGCILTNWIACVRNWSIIDFHTRLLFLYALPNNTLEAGTFINVEDLN